ncbi:hypothetical protein GEMRC1_007222 [Eukaryota sp. GEM-RC1]
MSADTVRGLLKTVDLLLRLLNKKTLLHFPPVDELFTLRDVEKQEKARLASIKKEVPIWLRETTSSLTSKKHLTLPPTPDDIDDNGEDELDKIRREATEAAASAAKGERESLSSFIDKKREMFFANLSLQSKKMEAIKLEKELKDRESHIVSENDKLKRQANELESMMQENDRKAVEAIKLASDEGKRKSEKIQELKRLHNQINQLSSEKSLLEEQLAEYLECKEFLLNLTPQDYIETQKKRLDTDSVDEIPLYFDDPQQLLRIFSELEDRNLFLIQNCQEREEELEKIRTKFSEESQRIAAQRKQMDAQIKQLQSSVDEEEKRHVSLQNRLDNSFGGVADSSFQNEIHRKVAEIYSLCDPNGTVDVGTLRMLTDLENFIDSLLSDLQKLPPSVLKRAQKLQEKERRDRQREEALDKSRQEKEKRIQAVLKRATEPIKKKAGKPVMFRSQLPKKNVKKTVTQGSPEKKDSMDDPNYSDFWQ